MSAATPTIGEKRVVYGRAAYMPEWTPVFDDVALGSQVRHDGTPLGFTVREMLPERRWAVTPQGDTLAQDVFERLYVQYASFVVRSPQGAGGGGAVIVAISAVNSYFDPRLVPVPRVDRFVAISHDYQGREIPIGFDPNVPPPKDAPPQFLVGADGKEIRPSTPSDEKVARLTVIADLRSRGVLTDEQASSELASVLLEPQEPAPPSGFERVTETAKPAEVEVAHIAKCGMQARSAAGRAAHERACDACQAVAEIAVESAA